MKTLHCRIMIVIMAAIVISLSGTATSMASDNSLYRDDSSSVFSPGYINAAKYQAETIMRQQTQDQDKSLLDKAIEFVQDTLANKESQSKTEQAQVTPKLQQKQSSQKSNSNTQALAAAQAAFAAANKVNPGEVPAFIRNSVQEYLDQGGFNTLFQVLATNGKYCAVWTSGTGLFAGAQVIKIQMFDSNGKAILASPPTIQTDDGAFINGGINSVSALNNGDIAIAWSEFSNLSDGTTAYTSKAQIFDTNGKALLTTPSVVDIAFIYNVTTFGNGNSVAMFYGNSGNCIEQIFDTDDSTVPLTPVTRTLTDSLYANTLNVTKLTNGNIAVVWKEGSDIKLQGFDAAGKPTLLLPATLSSEGSTAYIHTVTALPNGYIAVSWSDRVQIFDSNLKGVFLEPVIFTDLNCVDNVTVLANGNIAVFWDTISCYKVQILSTNGDASSPITLATNLYYIDKTVTLANGNIAVFWQELSDSNVFKASILSVNGTVITPSSVITFGGDCEGTSYEVGGISNVITLSNGNILVFWNETDIPSYGSHRVEAQVIDTARNVALANPVTLGVTTDFSYIDTSNIVLFANGNMAVFWREEDSNNYWSIKMQVFKADGSSIFTDSPVLTSYGSTTANINNITTFANGDIAVFWSEDSGLKTQVFDANGKAIIAAGPITLLGEGYGTESISNVTALANGDIAVFMSGITMTSILNYMTSRNITDLRSSYNSQIIDPSGNLKSNDILKPPSAATYANTAAIADNPHSNSGLSPLSYDSQNNQDNGPRGLSGYPGAADNAGSLKATPNNKDSLAQDMTGSARAAQDISDKTIKNSFKESNFMVSVKDYNAADMETATRLANILKNPTEDQKTILDAVNALLADTDKAKESSADKAKSEELKKAENDLLNAVANILLAQAMPDLLKKGDTSNIKAMFSELDTQRNKIMLDYNQSTKPYYENMLKDLAKNMAMLQGKNLLNPNMTKEELAKLPPSELDKILEKIKNMKDKAFEEEYILQQEAKYRKEYLDPNKKKLESDMKGMLNTFTGRINDVLKTTDKK